MNLLKQVSHVRRRIHSMSHSMSIEHLWVLALLAAAFTLVSVRPVPPHDFWWHARVGQQIVQQRAIPTVDTFSFTAQGRPMFYQSWLSEVLLYAFLRFGGLPWTILAQALLVTATYGGLYWMCRDVSNGSFRLAVFTTLWALFAASNNWAIRPQSFSFLPFLLFLWVLRRHARGLRAPLWILPAVMIVWVNLHGAFILGPILAVLVLLGMILDRFRVPSQKVGVTVQHLLNLPRIARIYTKKAKKLVKIRGIRGKKEIEAGVSRVVPERLRGLNETNACPENRP